MDALAAIDVLPFVLALQVKHAICDGPLQTRWMLTEKGHYGRPGGLVHATIHGAGSWAVVLVLGMAALPALALALADGLLHYHVDFAKENAVRRIGWSSDQPYFWWALQADQLVHQFTYVGLAAAAAMWS